MITKRKDNNTYVDVIPMVRGFQIPFILIFIFWIGIIVLCMLTGRIEAKIITVDDDGEADFEKIQDAINGSEDGDTIRVSEGTYYENVVVNKSVDLIGNGSGISIIDGGGNWHVVEITSDWVNMSGFKIIGSGLYRAGVLVRSNNIEIFHL